MRGYIPLLLALSASCTTVAALPKPRMQLRDDASKPKYSVVPLEPGDDDASSDGSGSGDGNGSSGSGSGGGDQNGDDVVTVIQTVVQTRKPVTQVITQTGKPSIVTVPGKTVTKAVPTTVSIINLDDQPVVTQTVTVSHPSASTPKMSGEPTATKEAETAESQAVTTAQEPSDSLTSAAAPSVTSQPQPDPQPQPQPEPKPEPSTSVETVQSIETSALPETQSVIIETVTVTQTSPTSESWTGGSNPTTLFTQTTQAAEVPEGTAAPSLDSQVAPTPPKETFVPGPASNQGESWSSATVPYQPPAVPTTLLTSCITSTTTSDYQHTTPEPTLSSKTHDDGAWHTTYPAWDDNDLAM
ncbi:hypothetical protein FSPOR_8204 [Fusarium sporotrichioides]|uniref:Uncharacterized protein n=1 Tax=Fusarium sporotrichioides TaxID=5514 RepID=A0A395RV59_FUSSP|nr:hypothetical protein FSPOR_8204 [Fusarium sporotrichioides]